jgi:hypothetical protein
MKQLSALHEKLSSCTYAHHKVVYVCGQLTLHAHEIRLYDKYYQNDDDNSIKSIWWSAWQHQRYDVQARK